MRYHNITKDDMLNGEGLRVVLWVAGCEHCCPDCQNPETWDINGGIPFDQYAKEEVFEELKKPYISGITLSGGDPFHHQNREGILQLVKDIKKTFPNKTIWAYTGYIWGLVKDLEVMKYLDVLVDGSFDKNLLDTRLHWIGSSNQRIIDVQESLKQDTVVLYLENKVG